MPNSKFNNKYYKSSLRQNGIYTQHYVCFTPRVVVVDESKSIFWDIENIIKAENRLTHIDLFFLNGAVLSVQEDGTLWTYCTKNYKFSKAFYTKTHLFYRYNFEIFVVGLIIIGIAMLWFLFVIAKENAYKIVSLKKERELGEILYKNTLSNYTVKDSASFYIQAFVDELNFDKNIPIKIVVVRSKELNAFAMPGGYVVVYDSMLRCTKNYQELVGLLAHEFSHVQLRHTLKTVVNQIGYSFLINIFLGDMGGLSNLVLNLNSLQYSRTLESAADANAIKLLLSKNISPDHFVNFLHTMQQRVSKNMLPEFLVTHPNFANREHMINAILLHQTYDDKKNKLLDYLYLKLKAL